MSQKPTTPAQAKCPFSGGGAQHSAGGGTSIRDWWPNQLNLKILHQHSSLSDPWTAASTTPKPSRASTCMLSSVTSTRS